MYFIDVILPIPLKQTFTYEVNKDEAMFLKQGMRVAVPFGKSKLYTGIVYAIHQVARRHSPGGRREGDLGGGRQGWQVRRPPVRHVPEDFGRDQGMRRAPRHLRRVRLHLQE